VDTASRSSKYPGLSSGATTSSARNNAYPGWDHCAAQRRTPITQPS
jgi:hypothetical protein